MAQPLSVALPPNLNLWGDCVIRVTAVDPTTGNTVSGVTVSDVTFEVEQSPGNRLPASVFESLLLRTGVPT